MAFREVKLNELKLNPFTKIGKEWLLITAGNEKSCNTMTASWGGMGVIWNKKVVTVYIRPQRYTKEFVDREETFTVAFFDEKYRESLVTCGRLSGRDTDKMKEAGLTVMPVDETAAFEEANLVMVCKKLYQDDIKPEQFIDNSLDGENYPERDYHTMYIAEVVKVLERTS